MNFLLSALRASLFLIAYTLSTVGYGLLSIPLRLCSAHTRHRVIISWTHVVVWLAKAILGIRYRVIGREKLQALSKPVVVMSKHQCAWETFFLQGLFWPANTVLKKELLSMPFFGWGLSALRPIAIDRSNPRQAIRQVKEEGVKRIQNDKTNLILFPEGTRVPAGQRVKYARSGAEIAASSGVYIVPVCHNAGEFWGYDKNFIKKPGTITVVIGDPIDSSSASSKELTANVEEWVETTLVKINNREMES